MRKIDINQTSVDLQLLTEFENEGYTVAYRGEESRHTEEMKEAHPLSSQRYTRPFRGS
ncbi:hypothetical protein [Listeria phage List-36]|uniref:Uncharacterized protein n=1 Tax=Listeria phage List-36 TaxID=1486422 RepID=A0A060ABR9_9CAUD|nr:hypothetical protein HH35_gp137 [Listeria phage List-36]AIA64315.1 hypothetical protein [Listeria phage List-36]